MSFMLAQAAKAARLPSAQWLRSASHLQCGYPLFESPGFMGHEFRLRQGVGEDGAALVSDDKFKRQVVGVVSAHGTELLLGPVQQGLHERTSGGLLAGR